jgi:hypothetical protein
MNLQNLQANIQYHERLADATVDRKLAGTHRHAAALLRSAYDAAHLDLIQRQALRDTRNAARRHPPRR